MKHCKLLSIDLAKTVFQICGLNRSNKEIFNRQVRRNKLLIEVLNAKPDIIFIESCYSATYWARLFQSHGLEVKLIPPQHVKAFVKGNKNDKHDALAIAEAGLRPNVHYVPVKTEEQQEIQILHKIRARYVRERTSITNQIRGFLSDYGIIINKGHSKLKGALPLIIEDASNSLTHKVREYLNHMHQEMLMKTEQLEVIKFEIEQLSSQQKDYSRLLELPGIGLLSASAIVARIGDAKQFDSARGMAAWLGLVPGHQASGTRITMQKITKRGDRYLRTLLIHCGRSVVNRYSNTENPLKQYAIRIKERRGKNIAAVAVAHKLVRIIWSMLVNDRAYNPNFALTRK
jgi:transposase